MKYTKQEIIKKFKEIHGNKYNYDKFEYNGYDVKSWITCPIHGDFKQSPNAHIHNHGCFECGKGTIKNKLSKNKEKFIADARKIHGDKYDYSKVNYINNHTNVTIICPIHGPFEQTPKNHLKGFGCKKCSGEKKSLERSLNKEEFIIRANKVHNNRFTYDLTNYKNLQSFIKVIDTTDGKVYEQKADSHIDGHTPFGNCWDSRKIKYDDDFYKKIYKLYGDKYDLSKVKYVNSKKKVTIICPIHGGKNVSPQTLLNGWECPECKKEREKISIERISNKLKKHTEIIKILDVNLIDNKIFVTYLCEYDGIQKDSLRNLIRNGCNICKKRKYWEEKTQEFIRKAKEVHGDKYDYSKSIYKSSKDKICIICPKHGEFWQTRENHLKGENCSRCAKEITALKNSKTTEEFIDDANKIWFNKFDYSKVKYVTAKRKVCIICPEHGEFWQKPDAHLNGYDCYECSKSGKTKESILKNMLLNDFGSDNVKCQVHFKWLGLQSLDFYLPKYNVAIEYQGGQHFYPIEYFGGEKSLQENRRRDILKNELCAENNCKILYFSFVKCDIGDFPYEVIFDYDKLKNEIINCNKNE